jgi:hypothetical protein
MKKILFLMSFLMISVITYAQAVDSASYPVGKAPLNKGDKQINFGLGLDTDGLPIYAQLDFAVSPDITVSPMAALTAGNAYSFTTIGVHSDYHFNSLLDIPSNWDFYAGVNLGFRFYMSSHSGTGPLDLGLQIGGRYYWNNQWGINLEFGGGAGFGGRVGVSKKL